jgi:hypothetical protein
MTEKGLSRFGWYRWLTACEFRPSEKLWIDFRPDMDKCVPWLPRLGWGGDEYGNPSIYLKCKLLMVVVFYNWRYFQRDVELPEPGVCQFVDRMFYSDNKEDFKEILARSYKLVDLPCGCQDVVNILGNVVDAEHTHVECDGTPE